MDLLAHTALTMMAKGRYFAEIVDGESDLSEAQALRSRCFGLNANDRDSFDSNFLHVLIRSAEDGHLVACFRMHLLEGREILSSYSAQYYALEALSAYRGPMIEMGRFCIDPDERTPDIVRLAWAAITKFVDSCQVKLLFGCSSFAGTDSAPYLDAFALLRDRHAAPEQFAPEIKAAEVIPFSGLAIAQPDPRRAMLGTPALLRTYLAMGGWVSNHAVVDREMNTLHVFTGVEITRIPPARKRLLRAMLE